MSNRCLRTAELRAVQPSVESAGFQQIGVVALLHQPSFVEHQDAVGGPDGGEAVGDHQRGAPFHDPFQGLVDKGLGFGVEMGGGLVEDEYLRVFQDHPGQGDPLLLAARQSVAPLPHHRVVSVRQGDDEVVDVGRPGGRLDLLLTGVRFGVAQVGGDGVVEEERLLGYDPHRLLQRLQSGVQHVHPVDPHPPPVQVVEAGYQVADGGLAGAGRAHQGGQLPRLYAEAHVLDGPRPSVRDGGNRGVEAVGGLPEPVHGGQAARLLRLVAEGHPVELDHPLDGADVHRPGALHDVVREVQNLEHPLEGDEGGGELHPGVGHGGQRAVQLDQQGGEHDHRAEAQLPLDHQVAAHPEHRRRTQGTDQPEGGEEPPPDHGRADAQIPHHPGLLREAGRLLPTAPEQLHQQGSAHVEGLVEDGGHGGVVLHLALGDAAQDMSHPPGRIDEQRQGGHRQQGEAPLGPEHHDQDHRHGDDVGGDGDEGAGYGSLCAHHVVVETGHQLSGLSLGEETQRHGLEVGVEGAAQVVDDPLPGPGRHPPLHCAHRYGDQRHGHHPRPEQGQPAEVGIGDGAVHQLPDEQGRDHRQRRDDQDRGQHPGQQPPVGAPVGEHTPQQGPVDLRHLMFLVVTQVGPESVTAMI